MQTGIKDELTFDIAEETSRSFIRLPVDQSTSSKRTDASLTYDNYEVGMASAVRVLDMNDSQLSLGTVTEKFKFQPTAPMTAVDLTTSPQSYPPPHTQPPPLEAPYMSLPATEVDTLAANQPPQATGDNLTITPVSEKLTSDPTNREQLIAPSSPTASTDISSTCSQNH